MNDIFKYIILIPFIEIIALDVLHMDSERWQYLTFSLYLIIVLLSMDHLLSSKSKIVWATIFYIVIISIFEILFPKLETVYNPYNRLAYLEWPLVGLVAWICGKKRVNAFGESNLTMVTILILVFTLVIGYAIWFNRTALLNRTIDDRASNLLQSIPYTLMWLLVVLFVLKSKTKFYLIGLLFLFILITLKRGPLFALLFGGFLVYAVNIKTSLNKVLKYGIPFIVIAVMLSTFFSEYVDAAIIRFVGESAGDNVTSRRDVIYTAVWESWLNCSLFNKIFGNGFEQTHIVIGRSLYGRAVGAHNDYLDILYNMGLFGLFIFLRMIYIWIKYCLTAIKTNTYYRDMMIMGVSCFVISSIFSSNIARMGSSIFTMFFYYACALMEDGTGKLRKYRKTKDIKVSY